MTPQAIQENMQAEATDRNIINLISDGIRRLSGIGLVTVLWATLRALDDEGVVSDEERHLFEMMETHIDIGIVTMLREHPELFEDPHVKVIDDGYLPTEQVAAKLRQMADKMEKAA